MLEYLLQLEEGLVHNKVCSSTSETLNDEVINDVFATVHANIVANLISYYMTKCCNSYLISRFSELFIGELIPMDIDVSDLDPNNIPFLCEELHMRFLESQLCFKSGTLYRKDSKVNSTQIGAVYTPDDVAHEIVYNTLNKLNSHRASDLKILDFATGTGRFYRKVVNCLEFLYGVPPEKSVVNNIFAIDIDPVALNICRLYAMTFFSSLSLDKAKKVVPNIMLKNGLIKGNLFSEDTHLTINDFGGIFGGGFHAIVSNPPYLVLKPNKKKMAPNLVERINSMVSYFRGSKDYNYSIEGMLNLYQLSIESMLSMLSNRGFLGVICPSTLFADISTTSLRKHLLRENEVINIKYFSEDDAVFKGVTQATCIFHLRKGDTTKFTKIQRGEVEYTVLMDDVKAIFESLWEFPSVTKIEWDILKKLLSCEKLKSIAGLQNKRGELDLTLHKAYITKEITRFRLVRGNMLSEKVIKTQNEEYVLEEFLQKKSREFVSKVLGKRRLVCQQISNQSQKRRLRFVESEPNDILGNSCNYIVVSDELLPFMRIILNSALLNWRFKITSTNNHINNYELGELPIIKLNSIPKDIFGMSSVECDRLICSLYGLNQAETDFIMKSYYENI